jgi:EmrB/QacA subfamily drug resistance transporter
LPPTASLAKLALVVLLGGVVVQLDSTMTNVAFNTFIQDFHSTISTIQWVGTGYLLAMTMAIPVTGWAVERFGARALWTVCITGFLIGSVLSGLAWSADSLIIFRVVQGIGGGMIVPVAQTVLAQAAGPDRMGRLMAVIAVPAMLAPVLGPVLGGWLVTDVNWRWIFFINVPICVLTVLLSWRYMPADKATAPGGGTTALDWLGLALLSPGCAGVVYGLARAGNEGTFGETGVVVALAAGVLLLVAFCLHALRSSQPLIDLRLFTSRTFAASASVVFVSGIVLFGAIILLPLYYQQVEGKTPLRAGLLLAPQGLGMAIALVIAGRLSDKIGPRPIVLSGIGLAAVGALVFTQIGPGTSTLVLSIALAVSGAGLGASAVPVLVGAYRGLRQEQIPRATSAIRIFQQLGGAFAGAVLAVVLQHAAGSFSAASDPGVLADAFGQTFWWVLGFAALSLLPAMLLPATAAPRPIAPPDNPPNTPPQEAEPLPS